MNTANRFSVCLLGLAAFAMALPTTKGWSTRYHVVKNFGADSSVVSLRFDSTWKSNDSLLARCMVKDSSLTKDSIRIDTAVLLTDTSGKQTWTDYSCLFPWEPGGLHNWEDSKDDLGKLSIRCRNGSGTLYGGSGQNRGIQAMPHTLFYSPVLTVWDSGAGTWSMIRDNAFGQEWRRIEPAIGLLQKNWVVGDSVPGLVSLNKGDSWKWEISKIASSEQCKQSDPVTHGCIAAGWDTTAIVKELISISVLERLVDLGYRRRWQLFITGSDSSQSWTSNCEYSSTPFGMPDSLRCPDLPETVVSEAKRILSVRHVIGWEAPRNQDGLIVRTESWTDVQMLYSYSSNSASISETLTSEFDLDRYDSRYARGTSKYVMGNNQYLSILLMEKNGQTIRSTAIQPARRAISPLLKALSPEQFHRALQQVPQVRELQIVGVSGSRQIVPARQFLSWAEHHRGVHWITYAGAPRAVQLLIP